MIIFSLAKVNTFTFARLKITSLHSIITLGEIYWPDNVETISHEMPKEGFVMSFWKIPIKIPIVWSNCATQNLTW